MSRIVGHYTIMGEIGRGGMAVVYRAVQESLNRTVALKELDLSRFRSEPNVLERFRLEARSAAALEHPNIVTVYDLWEEGDKAWIAMEFIDGVELKELLVRQGPLDFVSAVQIAIEVCRALHYAHGRGMVHRDVKPGNIMLSGSGEVRLMDFGIVSVSGTGDLTVTGQVLGTPAYMSPEQIAGEGLGPGSDMFSLGAILYEMFAGRRPFQGDNQLALIQRILHSEPVAPGEIAPEVPAALSDAVLKCLAKDPEDRYSSMEELAAVLGAVLPSGAADKKESVSRLAAPFGMPDQGDLPPAAGTGEETSVLRPAPGLIGKDAPEQSARSENGALETGMEAAGQTFSVGDSEYDVHPLELDPPAELPPLELEGTGEPGPAPDPPPVPVGGETEIPLSLKELPADENVEADGVPSAGRGGIRRYFLWSLPVILLIAAAGVWRFSGGPGSTLLPAKMINPAEPAKLTVLTEPGTSIFMDGKLLGEASPSGTFNVKPGLHRIEVRNPRLGKRTIIVEIEPGESKKIEVEFGK